MNNKAILLLVYFIMALILWNGVALIFIGFRYKYRKHKDVQFKLNRFYLSNLREEQLKKMDNDKLTAVFKDSGLTITPIQYTMIRIVVFAFAVSVLLLYYFKTRAQITHHIVLLLTIFILSEPVLKFGKHDTPFATVMKYLQSKSLKNKELEIQIAITQLKNLAISQGDKPLGADYILTQMQKFTKKTKVYFVKTQMLLRLNRQQEAVDYFSENVPSSLGREFALILVKLDHINPYELVEQLTTFQEWIRTENRTKSEKTQENVSNILMIIPTGLVFILMINFVTFIIFTTNTITKLS